MTALEVLIDEAAAALPLDPIEFRRRNALRTGGRTMTGNPYRVSIRTPELLDKLEAHPIWTRARDPSASRRQGRPAGRDRSRLRHQGLRHRRRLLARRGGDRPRRPDHRPRRRRRDGQRHRHRAGEPGGAAHRRRRRRGGGVADRQLRRSRPRLVRRPLHDGPGRPRMPKRAIRAGCRRSAPRQAPRSAPTSAPRRRPRRRASSSASACGRRRSSSGASAPDDVRARRWEEARWVDGALVLSATCRRCRSRSSPPAPMPRTCHRRDGARLLALGLVGRALPDLRRDVGRRDRRPGRSPRRRRLRRDRSDVGQLSPDRLQPDRHGLRLGVRHARSRRDRAGDRGGADRQGLQRAGMRHGAGAGGRARPVAGRLRHGRELCSDRSRCRSTRTVPATAGGTSAST